MISLPCPCKMKSKHISLHVYEYVTSIVILNLLHCTLQYFELVTHEITSHLESGQWCLQKAVSKTKGGATRSDVL